MKMHRWVLSPRRPKEEVEHVTRHDLKGPLTGIINLPALIRMDKNLTLTQEKYLDSITQAGFRMIEMINRSLNLYKMEIGKYQYSPSSLDFRSLIQRVATDLEGFCSALEVKVRLEIKEDKNNSPNEFIAPGEESLCFSLFQNLIQNAIEASPEHGTVTVTLSRRTGVIQVIVHNHGKVPDGIVDHFFDKYATFGKKRGTGLGTYSARLFTQIHGGQISMSTDSGRSPDNC